MFENTLFELVSIYNQSEVMIKKSTKLTVFITMKAKFNS